MGLEGQPTESYVRETRQENYALNLTAAPASNAILEVAGNWSGYERDDLIANAIPFQGTTPIDYTLADDLRSETVSGYFDYLAMSRTTLSLRGGRFVSDYRETGRPADPIAVFLGDMTVFPEIAPELIRPAFFSTVGNYQVDQAKYVRDDAALEARFVVNGRGYHEIVTGTQINNVTTDLESGLQNLYYAYFWDESLLGSDENRGEYGLMTVDYGRVSGHVENRVNAIFLQDTWTPMNGRLTVNAGLRLEEEEVPSFADPELGLPEAAIEFDYGDKVAPRIGFSWAVDDDQRWNLHGGYGTFYDRVKLEFLCDCSVVSTASGTASGSTLTIGLTSAAPGSTVFRPTRRRARVPSSSCSNTLPPPTILTDTGSTRASSRWNRAIGASVCAIS